MTGNEHGMVIEGWLWGECFGLDENAFWSRFSTQRKATVYCLAKQ